MVKKGNKSMPTAIALITTGAAIAAATAVCLWFRKKMQGIQKEFSFLENGEY